MMDAGGVLDLWAHEEQEATVTTKLHVWSRSPQALLEKLTVLDELRDRWALGGTIAANLFAPTLTIYPDPAIWVEAHIAPTQVANILDGEIVDKGSNLQIWQSDDNAALERSTIWQSASGIHNLRIVSRPRAYVEAIKAPGRSPEVAQNLRERILTDVGS
jgi:hypothetical protein